MASPTQLIQMAFAAGLDESQHDEVLDPMSAFPVLQNVRQDRKGGLSKRPGFSNLALTRFDSTSRSTGDRVISHNDLIHTIDGTYLDVYAESQALSVTSVTRIPEASCTARALTTVSSGFYDAVYVNGYIATASYRELQVVVGLETTSGVVVRHPEVMFTTTVTETAAQLVSYSTYIILLGHDSTTSNVQAWYLNTASASTVTTGWVSLGNVATDKTTSGTGAVGLSAQSLSNRIAFVYANNSGGTSRLTVKTMTFSGVTETATINTSSVSPDAFTIEGSISDTLWVAWNETTTIKVCGLDADNLAVTLATTGSIGVSTTAPGLGGIYVVSSSTAGAGRLGFNDGDGEDFCFKNFVTTAGACVASGLQWSLFGTYLRARPFLLGGRYYGLFRGGTSTNGISVLCDWTDTLTTATRFVRPVAMGFPSLTQVSALDGGHHLAFSATSVAYAMPVRRSSTGDSIMLLTYDFADRKRWRSCSHNGSLYLAGGILSYFDGRRVAEASFLMSPKTCTATDAGSGSGPNGSYRYVATYEEMDDDGNWCISAVSPAMTTAVSVTDNTINVSTTPLCITSRLLPGASGASAPDKKRIRVSFYRTVSGGSPPYYFVTSKENDTGIAVTYADSNPDSSITSNRQLYAPNLPGVNGDAQDRRAPPFCVDVVSYNGMLVVASMSDLWWSGQTISGEGVWFNPLFQVPVDGPGDIVALAVQDGTLYVFKQRSIHAVAGEAQNDTGTNGGLGTPRRLAVDVGCIEARSIVVTSEGIFFQSERGIELLTRAGAVVYVGEKVESTLASYPVVSSAVLDTRNSLVRFTLAASWSSGRVSGNGKDIVFDLTTKSWQSIDSKTGSSSTEASQDACVVVYGGTARYAWIGTDGKVWLERLSNDASLHLDSSTWVTMVAETASFKATGIQGRQVLNRVLLLARTSTDHNLSVSLSYNHETTFRTARTWARSEINTLLSSGWPVTQLKHDAHDDGECQAFRIRIEDATPTGGTVGTGKGSVWLALTSDVTPKPGAFEVPEEAA